MVETVHADIRVVDTDSHVAEPADLWTSRLPARWLPSAPTVARHPESSLWRWRVGDDWLTPVGQFAHAGWEEFFPGCPPTLDQADPASWDPKARLERMDAYGIYAQVMYPNIMGFSTWVFMDHPDQEFALACVAAYNDFSTEFASADRSRLIPTTVVPYWNMDAALAEIRRCAKMGHRGLLWANKFERIGLPECTHEHWDPIYKLAAELDLSINFHVAFASESTRTEGGKETEALYAPTSVGTKERPPDGEIAATRVRIASTTVLSNAPTIMSLITSDLCERFPTLKFVSVESGFGYVPYLLEAIDWNWIQFGARDAFGSRRQLPSEYFRRQCYGTFWFERGTLKLLEQYPDNFMFETDFPHPVSLSPGPGSYADNPRDTVKANIIDQLGPDLARKVLYDNAAHVYGL
jgi:predicted TIM-barrel fold metal-dependent hydrolase